LNDSIYSLTGFGHRKYKITLSAPLQKKTLMKNSYREKIWTMNENIG